MERNDEGPAALVRDDQVAEGFGIKCVGSPSSKTGLSFLVENVLLAGLKGGLRGH